MAKDLTPAEKMMCGEIDALSKKTGWCEASRAHFAEWLQCSEANISNYWSKLEKAGFIEVEKTPGRRSKIRLNLARFWAEHPSAPLTTPVSPTDGHPSAPLTPPVSPTDPKYKREIQKGNTSKNNVPHSRLSPAKQEPWTKKVSRIFDEVNEAENAAAGIDDFQRFNWIAGAGRQFAALKQIKKALASDLHLQPGETALTEGHYEKGFRSLFEFGFRYLKKIADSKGGPVQFSPATVLNNYNQILNFARNGNRPGTSKQVADAERRRAAQEELVKQVLDMDLG